MLSKEDEDEDNVSEYYTYDQTLEMLREIEEGDKSIRFLQDKNEKFQNEKSQLEKKNDEVDKKYERESLKNNTLACNMYLTKNEYRLQKSDDKVQNRVNKHVKLCDSVKLNNTHYICLVCLMEEEKKVWMVMNLDETKVEDQKDADDVKCSSQVEDTDEDWDHRNDKCELLYEMNDFIHVILKKEKNPDNMQNLNGTLKNMVRLIVTCRYEESNIPNWTKWKKIVKSSIDEIMRKDPRIGDFVRNFIINEWE